MTQSLARLAARRPYLFVVGLPGATEVRLAVEAEARRRGWPAALSPSGADVLVVAGPVPAGLAAAVGEVWEEIPAPRARAEIDHPGRVGHGLDRAAADLAASAEPGHHHDRRRDRRPAGHRAHSDDGHGDSHGSHEPMGDMAAGGDLGEMEMPGGLPMADRGADRDGLRLDRLHVSLGPVLADWPAGLALHLIVQGDVVQEARAAPVGADAGEGFWSEPWEPARTGETVTVGVAARRRAASHLDSLGRFLAVAGWSDPAGSARALRDDLLAGLPSGDIRPRCRRLAHWVGGSRTLSWMTRGLGVIDTERADALGISGPAAAGGDVCDRYRQWLSETTAAVGLLDDTRPLRDGPDFVSGPRGRLDGPVPPSRSLMAAAEALVVGEEVGAARLIVASLDPDLDELAHRTTVLTGG